MNLISKMKFLFDLKGHADKLIELLKGKKTIIGAVSMLLWFVIYGVPILFPEYLFLVDIAMKLQEWLLAVGVELDKEFLAMGAGITAIGLLDKVRRLFSKDGKN